MSTSALRRRRAFLLTGASWPPGRGTMPRGRRLAATAHRPCVGLIVTMNELPIEHSMISVSQDQFTGMAGRGICVRDLPRLIVRMTLHAAMLTGQDDLPGTVAAAVDIRSKGIGARHKNSVPPIMLSHIREISDHYSVKVR